MTQEQRIKAVWRGTGAEPKYQEYGYGTGRAIPSQIWAQYGNPESNWEFVYADDSSQQQNSISKFLSTPVWFYNTEAGPAYTLNRGDVPQDASEVQYGHVMDVYRLYGEATRRETASKPITPKDLQARRLKVLEALWKSMSEQKVAVEVDDRGMLSISKTTEGEQTLLPLLVLSLTAKNSNLIVSINKFAESSAQNIKLNPDDIFGQIIPGSSQHFRADTGALNENMSALLASKTKADINNGLIKLARDVSMPHAESDESLEWKPTPSQEEASIETLQKVLEDSGSTKEIIKPPEDTRPEPENERDALRRRAEAAMMRQVEETLTNELAASPQQEISAYIKPVEYVPPKPTSPKDLVIEDFDPLARTKREVKPFDPLSRPKPSSDRPLFKPPPQKTVAEMVAALPARFTPTDIKEAQKEFKALLPSLTTSGISKGGHFINSIPEDVMSEAVSSMSEANKLILIETFPGLFKLSRDMKTVELVPTSARDVSSSGSMNSTKKRGAVAVALEEFSAKLDKLNFRTRISPKEGEFSPLFLDNLPARSSLDGAEIKNLVSTAQQAFMKSLVRSAKRTDTSTPELAMAARDILTDQSVDLNSLGRTNEQVLDSVGKILSRIGRYAYDTDDDGNISYTAFGHAIKRASDAQGISEKEVIEQIKSTVLSNLSNVKRSHASIYNSGQSGTTQGIAMGMMMGAMRGAMKAGFMKNNANNGMMHLVHEEYPDFVEELTSGRVFMSSDDLITYTTLNGKEVYLSTSMWQFMHTALPYYKNQSGDLILQLGGQEINFTNLDVLEKEPVRDAFMEYLADQTNPRKAAAFESEDVKYFALKKYQSALYSSEELGERLSRTLGSRVSISKLDKTDSVYNEDTLAKAQQSVASINNFLLSGVSSILANNTYPGYDHIFPDKQSKVKAYMTFKITSVMKDVRSIADSLGVSDANYDNFTRILEDSMKAYVNDYVTVVNEKSEGNFTSAAGYSAEYLSMITPIISMMIDPRFKDHKFEFEGTSFGDYFRNQIPTDRLIDMGAPSGSEFMDSEINLRGFIFHVNGEEHAIVKDVQKVSGSGDVIHMATYKGQTQLHDLETKMSKGEIEKAHLSYISPNMRLSLLLGKRSGAIAVGGSRTLNLVYEKDGHASPTGLPQHERERLKPHTNKYGVKYNATSGVINGREFMNVVSGYDGFGLSGIVPKG